jgi:hypothetical protein
MNEFISDSQRAFRAHIRLFRFAWGTTLIEIAVYMVVLGEHTANQGHVTANSHALLPSY